MEHQSWFIPTRRSSVTRRYAKTIEDTLTVAARLGSSEEKKRTRRRERKREVIPSRSPFSLYEINSKEQRIVRRKNFINVQILSDEK